MWQLDYSCFTCAHQSKRCPHSKRSEIVKQTSFSHICDICAIEMDRLTIAKDYDALASYVL